MRLTRDKEAPKSAPTMLSIDILHNVTALLVFNTSFKPVFFDSSRFAGSETVTYDKQHEDHRNAGLTATLNELRRRDDLQQPPMNRLGIECNFCERAGGDL